MSNTEKKGQELAKELHKILISEKQKATIQLLQTQAEVAKQRFSDYTQSIVDGQGKEGVKNYEIDSEMNFVESLK